MNRQIDTDVNILRLLGMDFKKGMYKDEDGFVASQVRYTDTNGKEVTNYYDRETGDKLLPKHLWETARAITKEQEEAQNAV
jgi:hypothetical protein